MADSRGPTSVGQKRFWQVGPGAVLAAVVFVQLFQNCGPVGFKTDFSSVSTELNSMGVNHPGATVVAPTSQKGVIANRLYVTELFKDVFGPSAETINTSVHWVYSQAALFGFPCNPKRSDCFSSGHVPMNISGDTLRSARKMQTCLALTSNDATLSYALRRIEPNSMLVSPNELNVPLLYELFYRGDDPPSALIEGLIEADHEALRQNPKLSLQDRWRLLILAVCESSGWESL